MPSTATATQLPASAHRDWQDVTRGPGPVGVDRRRAQAASDCQWGLAAGARGFCNLRASEAGRVGGSTQDLMELRRPSSTTPLCTRDFAMENRK